MELRQLRHFVAIVEARTFALAARRVGITQPALSRSLRMLESSLKTRLIERGVRCSIPTAAGERFLPYARSILADCDRAHAAFAASDDPAAEFLVIGVTEMLSTWAASTLGPELRREFPSAQIYFREGRTEDLEASVWDGAITCALLAMNRQGTDTGIGVDADTICALPSVVIASAELADRCGTPASMHALLGRPWVTITGLDDHLALHDQSRCLGVASPSITTTDSPGRMRALILQDGYVALAPRQFLDAGLGDGALRVLGTEVPGTGRHLAMLHGKDSARALQAIRIRNVLHRLLGQFDEQIPAVRLAARASGGAIRPVR